MLIIFGFKFFQDLNTDSSVEIQKEENQSEDKEIELHEDSSDYVWSVSDIVYLDLSGNTIETNSNDVEVDGSVATIKASGTYSLSGILSDGQIVIDTDDNKTVRLILNGVSINYSDGPSIYVEEAKKVIVVLEDGTENYLSDGDGYGSDEEDSPNATVFSTADLTIYGLGGSLVVDGNYKNAISSKDGLIIKDAILELSSVDDAVRGKDYLIVENSDLSIEAGDNGLKSDNEDSGYITLSDSDIDIVSGGDAINSKSDITITNVDIDILSGGGSTKQLTSSEDSMKGIKATNSIVIYSGNINIDSADDALHSNNELIVNSGVIDISSGDDGLHADSEIEINGGEITISKSYEGIESKVVTINDGDIYIVSSDDGINIAGGNDDSSMGGRMGQGEFAVEGDSYLYINGGYIFVNASGDGLDSNGSIVMTGGDVIVSGPTNNGNGALDYNGTFDISGGSLVATGSSGMALAVSSSSSQYSLFINLTSSQGAGTEINIQTENGEDVLTLSPVKTYQSITFSSSDLENGEIYNLYVGGELIETFTISSIITNIGTAQGGMQGGGMNMNNMDGTMTMPQGGGGMMRR
jgi:hypothetical protein